MERYKESVMLLMLLQEPIAKLLIERGINITPEQKTQLQELDILPVNKVEAEFTQEIITPVEDINTGILVGAQLILVVEEV